MTDNCNIQVINIIAIYGEMESLMLTHTIRVILLTVFVPHFSGNPRQWHGIVHFITCGWTLCGMAQTALLTTLVVLNPWFYREF